MSILSALYSWAVDEELASAVPFTYKQAVTAYGDQFRLRPVNTARRRMPKPHVTIKYFEEDFEDLFVKGLAGLCPDGSEDLDYRGRTTARNAAVGGFALSSGMRRQEFTYLLRCEVPALPRRRPLLPIRVPTAAPSAPPTVTAPPASAPGTTSTRRSGDAPPGAPIRANSPPSKGP
ncbi:hypothetical protein ACFWP2_36200 [Kitasatospora sp. NPDC058444]|uniref:hypothetical protein n=1 Tax=Kitasatospora sp. NPDC058444 TaxID=3346504 RepID=UPI003669CF5E